MNEKSITIWEEIIVRHIFHLVSRVYEGLPKYNSRKSDNLIFKNVQKIYANTQGKEVYVWIVIKHVKSCSTVLVIREVKVKPTMRYC